MLTSFHIFSSIKCGFFFKSLARIANFLSNVSGLKEGPDLLVVTYNGSLYKASTVHTKRKYKIDSPIIFGLCMYGKGQDRYHLPSTGRNVPLLGTFPISSLLRFTSTLQDFSCWLPSTYWLHSDMIKYSLGQATVRRTAIVRIHMTPGFFYLLYANKLSAIRL